MFFQSKTDLKAEITRLTLKVAMLESDIRQLKVSELEAQVNALKALAIADDIRKEKRKLLHEYNELVRDYNSLYRSKKNGEQASMPGSGFTKEELKAILFAIHCDRNNGKNQDLTAKVTILYKEAK